MKKYIIAAAGPDQSGIVAALSKALFDIGANLEDTTMCQLEDHFMVMMMVQSTHDLETLRQALKDATAKFGLMLNVYSTNVQTERLKRTGTPWLMSVTCLDQTGVIYQVTELLTQWQANIYQLSSRRLLKDNGDVLFLLSMEVDIPDNISDEVVQNQLDVLAEQQKLDIQAHPLETFVL